MHITLKSVLATMGLAATVMTPHVSALPTRTDNNVIVPRKCGSGQPTSSHSALPASSTTFTTLPSPTGSLTAPIMDNNDNHDGDGPVLLLPGSNTAPSEPYFPPTAPEPCPTVGQQLCGWFYPAGPSRMECQADGAYHVLGPCPFGDICEINPVGKAVCVPQ